MADPLLLGVEIGGTKLQLGLGRGDGRVLRLARRAIRPEDGADGILAQIERAYADLIADLGDLGPPPEGAGIGFGGPVDADRGVAIRSHQVEGWDGFDFSGWTRTKLGIGRVAVQNDADTAGLGEATFGAGVGQSPVLYVTVGSGIGGGLIVDGRIYRGAGLGAAEIGHLWIDGGPDGPRRLEDIASGWAIGAAARGAGAGPSGLPSFGDAATIAASAASGDPAAVAILGRAAEAMGTALAHAATLLAPRRIILGGGVSLIGEALWFGPIRRRLRDRVFPPFRESFDLVAAELGESVVVHGALALARLAMIGPGDVSSTSKSEPAEQNSVL